jgi:YHS domain-containing protein
MGFLLSLFRFLFLVVILSWCFSLLKKFFAWFLGDVAKDRQQEPPPRRAAAANHRLVRDPICGTHVAEELAVTVTSGSEVVHFCSAACRDEYLSGTRKMAANG